MAQFTSEGLSIWVIKRLLGFFNRAYSVKDITEGILKDDPNSGTGSYLIGEVVAQRILDRRNELPSRLFTEVEQLSDIAGLGPDKFHDLVYTFSIPSAEAFRQGMYARVIGDNWNLKHYSVQFDDREEFRGIVDDPEAFRQWLKDQLVPLVKARTGMPQAGAQAKQMIEDACVQVKSSGHLSSYALALWFYSFDADNWFSFEQVQKEAATYLDFMPFYADRTELRMLVGFENRGLLADSVTVKDLPVVISYAEQTISIWVAQLND